MQAEKMQLICRRCGYNIDGCRDARCPRCLEPVHKYGTCGGRCGNCRKECLEAGNMEQK